MLPTNENLPQLYRFCYLMTGDGARAQEAFQATLREAALHATQRETAPRDRLWFFRDARWRCVAALETGLQPESTAQEECEVEPTAPQQIAQLQPEQLAAWISAAPEPQRSALAAYYLDEFSLAEMLTLLDLRARELSELVTRGRCEFQAWLHAHTAHFEQE
ncbi:MAG: RNA polymerase sigma factor [Chthoniobacterales bacterium]